jgi:hypothetical protein
MDAVEVELTPENQRRLDGGFTYHGIDGWKAPDFAVALVGAWPAVLKIDAYLDALKGAFDKGRRGLIPITQGSSWEMNFNDGAEMAAKAVERQEGVEPNTRDAYARVCRGVKKGAKAGEQSVGRVPSGMLKAIMDVKYDDGLEAAAVIAQGADYEDSDDCAEQIRRLKKNAPIPNHPDQLDLPFSDGHVAVPDDEC